MGNQGCHDWASFRRLCPGNSVPRDRTWQLLNFTTTSPRIEIGKSQALSRRMALVPIPTAILSGPEPNTGILQTQSTIAKDGRNALFRIGPQTSTAKSVTYTVRLNADLLRGYRICLNLKAKRLERPASAVTFPRHQPAFGLAHQDVDAIADDADHHDPHDDDICQLEL